MLSAKDQSLLYRWDSLLFLDSLLYPGDLFATGQYEAVAVCRPITGSCSGVGVDRNGGSHLVVGFDIQLDFLAGERADPVPRDGCQRGALVLPAAFDDAIGGDHDRLT